HTRSKRDWSSDVCSSDLNEISYLNFMGGKYTLRVLWDQNKNGRWDPGNVYTKKQAEPIWYFDKVFTVRANWEQNDEINVTFDSQIGRASCRERVLLDVVK